MRCSATSVALVPRAGTDSESPPSPTAEHTASVSRPGNLLAVLFACNPKQSVRIPNFGCVYTAERQVATAERHVVYLQ